MKKLFPFILIFLLSNCSISDKIDNLKIKIDTSAPIGSYNITAKNLIQDEDNRDMLETEEDGSLSYFFKLDTYEIANAETLESLYRIEDQSTNTNFNISTITHNIPIGENILVEINETNQNIFTQTVEFIFTDNIKPKKINFESGEIEITSNSLSSYENLYVTIEEFTKNGTPLKFKLNTKTMITEDYDFVPKIDSNGRYLLTIKVSGSTILNRNSTFENTVSIKNLKLISFEGDLGRQETESDTKITFDDFKDVYDIVEEFYPNDIIFNLNITKEYEELPILVIVEKAQFVNGKEIVNIPLKNEFNKDRFFLEKGENKIIINNSCTVSGTDISDGFSAETEELLLSYKIITNPTDEDALSDVKQNHENKIRGDCEFPSKLKFVMPISGYVKGINYDVIIPVSFDAEEFDASELSYCLTADNQLPIDFDISIVIIDKETKEILSSEKEVTNIRGNEKLSFDTKNIRTFSKEEADLFSDKSKNAGVGIYIKGNSIGYENKETITLFSEDNLTLNLFLGIKGNFNL